MESAMTEKIRLLFGDNISQPDAVKAMGEAYDLACEEAPEVADHEALARAIIAVARAGERDPFRLCDAALYQISRKIP
jgi:hypothetical protein